MRVELGSGQRPTPGFVSTDSFPHPGLELVCDAWELDFPDESCSEVLALGVMEHLTFQQFADTVANVRRMLKPGGEFLFDVPDLAVWCRYLVDWSEGRPTPFPIAHIQSTLYGWQRWPGDEHKSGYTRETLMLAMSGWTLRFGVHQFLERGYERRRMTRPEDAHLYVCATK